MLATWNYHLLNHLHYSYTLINAMTLVNTIAMIVSAPLWRKVLRRYSWIKSFGLTVLMWVPIEFGTMFLTEDSEVAYVLLCIAQYFILAGITLAASNLFYLNLPTQDTNVYTIFNNICYNISAFLGTMTGTFLSSITGDHTMLFLNREWYSVQFIPMARGILMIALGLVAITKWKLFTPELDILEMEHYNKFRKKQRVGRKALFTGIIWEIALRRRK